MRIIRTVAELRAALDPVRRAGKTIGVVPTMGAFHDGHRSLMRRAAQDSDLVVVSLFVNPTQFNRKSDLESYPRDEAADAAQAAAEAVDLLFAPSPAEMYPNGFATSITVTDVSEPLEGAHRGPAHFIGVATVVAKLFNIVQPDAAYFGAKDAQQALVIQRMVRDLDIPVRLVVCPIVRETDGLAMSSRNALLPPEQRPRALALRRGLDAARNAITAGARDPNAIEAAGMTAMRTAGVEPEYFALRSATTLQPLATAAGDMILAVAAQVGPVRLIDNERITLP